MANTEPPAEGVANVFAAGIEQAYHRVKGDHAQARTAHVAGLLEQVERDLVPFVAPFLTDLLESGELPAPVHELLAAVAAPEHFTQALLLGVAVAGILQPLLSAITAPAVQALTNVSWHGAATTPGNPGTIHISPSEAAIAVLKGVFDQPHGATLAAYSGTSADDFDHLVRIAGQSLGYQEALLLQRRGQLVNVTLDDVLRYSNVNPEFYASALNLLYESPGIGSVLAARVKSHLDDTQALKLYTEAGGNPDNYLWERDTAGRPPGAEQMLSLWNRGDATEADVDAAIAQSDIAPHFAPFVKQLRVYIPPPRSIVPMLRSGAITEAYAQTLFAENGVRPADAAAFVTEAHTTKATATKAIGQAQIIRAYEAQLLTASAATAKLTALKYPADEIALMLELADDRRELALQEATIRMIGARYVAHHIAQPEAASLLGQVQIPALAQAQLFKLWDIERAANVHTVTVAQVVGAYRRGEIDASETRTRLLALGVQVADLGIVVADGFAPTKPDPAKVEAVLQA